ncbi:MAG: hypothetical protein QM831_43890 [Kofleriaceae bacterium]
MPKTVTDAQLRELLKSGASAYQERENDLNTRELQAQRVLDMMIEVIQPTADYLVSLKVPANLKRLPMGLMFEVGQSPNTSGQLLVNVTKDFKLAIIERTISGAGDIGTREQPPRHPSDFGAPHWRGELAQALTWILGEPTNRQSNDDDDDDDDE